MVAERDFACNVTTKFVGAHASQYQGLSRMDVSVGQQLTDPGKVEVIIRVGRLIERSLPATHPGCTLSPPEPSPSPCGVPLTPSVPNHIVFET